MRYSGSFEEAGWDNYIQALLPDLAAVVFPWDTLEEVEQNEIR